MSKRKYIVADYYEDFSCKCGECRSSCCVGWPISVSYEEYCRYIGLNCAKNLRRKLDCAFVRAPYATKEEYAQIAPDWRGDCPLHDEDGYCSLHKHLGEKALPTICRMYPRSVREGIINEKTCSNSCEKVLEMMFSEGKRLKLKICEEGTENFDTKNADTVMAVQIEGVRLIQSGEKFCDKFFRFAEIISVIKSADTDLYDFLVGMLNAEDSDVPEIPTCDLSIVKKLLSVLSLSSDNLADAAEEACKRFGIADMSELTKEAFNEKKQLFCRLLPKHDIYFGCLLANHILFKGFPLNNSGESVWQELLEIAATYVLSKFLAVGCIMEDAPMTSFVDCLAKIFRCFDHSDITPIVTKVFAECKIRSCTDIASFCKI